MKTLAIYLAKKYALSAVKDAIRAHGTDVAKWASRIGVWLGKLRVATAYLERLAERLNDGELDDAEADSTIKEAEVLAKEITA